MSTPEVISHATSQALAEIELDERTRAILLAGITAGSQPEGGLVDTLEAGLLMKTLDELVRKVQDKAARNRCLRILSEVCRERATLPESYIVSDITPGKKWHIGGAADVWAGKHGEKDVCIKVFRKHEGEQQDKIKGIFYHHVVRWKYVSHENVLPFLGISEAIPPFGIVSPQMPNDILKYIKENQNVDRISLLVNAACGIKYLHSLDIVHGGIKPGNILITAKGTACIGDFEIAKIVTDPLVTAQCGATTCRRGIIRYMAPEQINPRRVGMTSSAAVKESDVYSFAMTAYEVLTGNMPYAGITGDGPLAIAISGDVRPLRPSNDVMAEIIWGMVESCWHLEPNLRPPIKEVHRMLRNTTEKVDGPISRDEKRQEKIGFLDKIRGLVSSCYHPRSMVQ